VLRRAANAYRSAFSGLSRDVWILALAALVNRSGTMVLPFLSLYLTSQRGFSPAGAGQALSLYGIGAIAGSWLGGWASDRIGSVRVQATSLVGTGIGFIVLGQLRTHGAIALALLGLSVVAECFRPAMFTSVARFSAPAVRARSLALVRLAVNLGMAVGPAVGGLLAVHHYGLLFVADGATCWLAALLMWGALRERPEGRAPVRSDTEPGAASPWRDRPFVAFLVIMVVLGTVFFQIWSTLPLYLRGVYRFSEARIGLLLALNPVMIVLFEMLLLRAVEHLNHLAVAGVGCLFVGAGLGLMPFGSGVWFAAVTVVVWTIGEMLSLPFTNSVAASRSASASGSYLGAYSLSFSLAFAFAPALGLAVYGRLGAAPLWTATAVAGAALCLGCLWLAPRFAAAPSGDPTRTAAE
jgi:predicted MFS family arabinose efflux permease